MLSGALPADIGIHEHALSAAFMTRDSFRRSRPYLPWLPALLGLFLGFRIARGFEKPFITDAAGMGARGFQEFVADSLQHRSGSYFCAVSDTSRITVDFTCFKLYNSNKKQLLLNYRYVYY